MYSHCLGTTGFLRRQREQQGHFHPLSLVDWLKLFDNATSAGKPKGAGQYCYYNPVNYQTHLLATIREPIGRYDVPAYALDRVRQLIQTAFFVGVTEYYATLKRAMPFYGRPQPLPARPAGRPTLRAPQASAGTGQACSGYARGSSG